jgi:hypothetical protein
VTILLVAWGQFIDHDITLTGETKVNTPLIFLMIYFQLYYISSNINFKSRHAASQTELGVFQKMYRFMEWKLNISLDIKNR